MEKIVLMTLLGHYHERWCYLSKYNYGYPKLHPYLLFSHTYQQLRKGGFNLRLILGDKEEEQGAMQCGTSISNVTRLYVSLQLNGAKKKKQFVGIRFVQLAFLRKMLGTTKYKKERYISPIEPQRCTLQ